MSKNLYGSLALATALLIGSQSALAANLAVVQQDLPVGTNITVGGIKYQIMQFEVPAFDSDKIYLVKFPVSDDPASTTDYFSSYVYVYGSTTPQTPHQANTINVTGTGLSGFKAFYDESYGYNASYGRFSSRSTISNQLSLSNSVGIQLDAKTYVTLSLANKDTTQTVSSTAHTPDTTTKLKATPTASTRALRNKFLIDSRALFKYVVIKEKL